MADSDMDTDSYGSEFSMQDLSDMVQSGSSDDSSWTTESSGGEEDEEEEEEAEEEPGEEEAGICTSVEDIVEKVIDCEQSTCEGHLLKVQFIIRKSYTLDTATVEEGGVANTLGAATVEEGGVADTLDGATVEESGVAGNSSEQPPKVLNILLPHSKCSKGKPMKNYPLHWACAYGHVDVISILLDNGACVHSQGFWGWQTPLHLASERGQLEAVNMILARELPNCNNGHRMDFGDVIDVCGKWGDTALHFACRYGHFPVVNALIAQGATVYCENKYEQLPLHLACLSGNLDIVNILLEKEPDTARSRNEFNANPLHFACERGHVDIAKALLKYEACIEQGDVGKIRPLHLASRFGHVEMVNYLLSVGANINTKDKFMQTPLHYAIHYGKGKVVNTLLAHGAAIDVCDNLGKTPLHWACEKGYLAAAKSLLASGASTSVTDNSGKAPLHCIGVNSCLEVTVLDPLILVNRCCNIDQDRPRLDRATAQKLCRALLLSGADVNAKYKKLTALEFGARHSITYSQSILLDYGMGSGRPCRKPSCVKSELLCIYFALLESGHKVDGFEQYFIKREAAGLRIPEDERASDPSKSCKCWARSLRAAYRKKCEAELEKLKANTIANTSATFFDLLSKDLSSLRDQQIIGNFNANACVVDYPIYGDMIGCSYVRLRRLLLVDQTYAFFYLTEPHLPPECARGIQSYLANEDFDNLLKLCQPYRGDISVSPDDLSVIESRQRALASLVDTGECSTAKLSPASSTDSDDSVNGPCSQQ